MQTKDNQRQSTRIYDRNLKEWFAVPVDYYKKYDRERTAFRKRIRRTDVAVIQFFYNTSHVATSFGRDTQYQNATAISRRKVVCLQLSSNND